MYMDSRTHTRRTWDEQRTAEQRPFGTPILGLAEGGAADGVVSGENIKPFLFSFN